MGCLRGDIGEEAAKEAYVVGKGVRVTFLDCPDSWLRDGGTKGDNRDCHNDLRKTGTMSIDVVGKGKECEVCGGGPLEHTWGHWNDGSRMGGSGLGDYGT